MSQFTFASDVKSLKYIYGEQLEYLVEKHEITLDEAMDAMIKIGFERGMSKEGIDEYWNKKELT